MVSRQKETRLEDRDTASKVPVVVRLDVGVEQAITSLVLHQLGGVDHILHIRLQQSGLIRLPNLEVELPLLIVGSVTPLNTRLVALGDVVSPPHLGAHERAVLQRLMVAQRERVVAGVLGTAQAHVLCGYGGVGAQVRLHVVVNLVRTGSVELWNLEQDVGVEVLHELSDPGVQDGGVLVWEKA